MIRRDGASTGKGGVSASQISVLYLEITKVYTTSPCVLSEPSLHRNSNRRDYITVFYNGFTFSYKHKIYV